MSSMILFPTDSKTCTFTSGPATIPLTMFLRVGSDVKGEQDASFVRIFSRSDASLLMRASVKSLCCGLVIHVRSVKSCIALFTGVDKGCPVGPGPPIAGPKNFFS